ncbi:MAG: hypothetical protein JW969_05975 [Spirochaetales bacterium]|nr:hypothetical protein [Spirochaetales bacterium]
MGENDREIRIGENRVYLGEDDIYYFTFIGDLNEETALEFRQAIMTLNERFGKKVRGSISDINRLKSMSYKARQILREWDEEMDTTSAYATIVGLHPVARVIASFFMRAVPFKGLQFFKTIEEARAWLKERANE